MDYRNNNQEYPKSRDHAIDVMGGIGILLVVVGHATTIPLVTGSIYSFHMPLFFFLSGLLFKDRNYITAGEIQHDFWEWTGIRHKFRAYIVPFVFLYLGSYIWWLFVEGIFRPLEEKWYMPLLDLVTMSKEFSGMAPNRPLWFLPCLFCVEVLFAILYRILYRHKLLWGGVICLTCCGYYLIPAVHLQLPLCFNSALVALVFYYLGFLSKKSWETRTGYMESFSYAIVYGIAFFACLHVFHYKGLNLAYSVYDRSLLLVVLCAGLGIGMTANLSKLVSNNRFLEFLGRNSLLIFGTHLVVMRVVIFLFSKIQTLTIVELKEDLLQSLLISATTLLLVMLLLFMQHFIIKTQK